MRARIGAAELGEAVRGEIEHPEIAARILAPDAGAVGEDQEFRVIGGPFVVLDIERRARAGGREEAALTRTLFAPVAAETRTRSEPERVV